VTTYLHKFSDGNFKRETTRRFDIKVIFNLKDFVRAFKENFRLIWGADSTRCWTRRLRMWALLLPRNINLFKNGRVASKSYCTYFMVSVHVSNKQRSNCSCRLQRIICLCSVSIFDIVLCVSDIWKMSQTFPAKIARFILEDGCLLGCSAV
jgi:hypothetical protein